jgi:hypothetical protein
MFRLNCHDQRAYSYIGKTDGGKVAFYIAALVLSNFSLMILAIDQLNGQILLL